MLRLRPAEPFNEEIVRGDVERVLRHYDEQGYEGTTVAEEISREAGEVRVTYRIREGRPRVVREVILRGNSGLGRAEILGALGMANTPSTAAPISSAARKARDFYQRRGYLDVGSSHVEAAVTGVSGGADRSRMLSLGAGGYRLAFLGIEEASVRACFAASRPSPSVICGRC
jgi:hypothetical protein